MKKLTLFLLLGTSINLLAQVGINTEVPNEKTLLDIEGSNKGIMIPRLNEEQRDQLTFNKDNKLSLSEEENSLLIYNTTEDCYNYWHQVDKEWKSLCGALGKSRFDLDCSTVKAEGEYIIEKDTDGTNFISVKVSVDKPGTWSIAAKSEESNGYSFIGQGVFAEKGSQTVKLYAQGTPARIQKDQFKITSTGGEDYCDLEITVQTNTSSYSLQCSSAYAEGVYVKGVELNETNTIKMNVNVSEIGSYSITTPLVNGIRFTSTGTFNSTGSQQITLRATGAPKGHIDFPISINANTVNGNATCKTTIPMTLPKMTYGIIGNGWWSWGEGARKIALESEQSFGPNGITKTLGIEELWHAKGLGSVEKAIKHLNDISRKPDIILYFSYGAKPTEKLSTALANYVNQGGVLIYGSTDGDEKQTNIMMKGIFGVETAQKQIKGKPSVDNVYAINNIPNDPIINGPFGEIGGKYWGEDNDSDQSIVITQLPSNSIQIASAYNQFGKQDVNPNYSMVWYNDSKNFVYFGDSVGASKNNLDKDGFPASYSDEGIPQSKFYGNWPRPASAPGQFVFNSTLELNVVAWAIRKAATSGINPH